MNPQAPANNNAAPEVVTSSTAPVVREFPSAYADGRQAVKNLAWLKCLDPVSYAGHLFPRKTTPLKRFRTTRRLAAMLRVMIPRPGSTSKPLRLPSWPANTTVSESPWVRIWG